MYYTGRPINLIFDISFNLFITSYFLFLMFGFGRIILLLMLIYLTNVSYSQIYSVNHGSWSNPAIWSCGCVPSGADDVVVRHVVSIGAADGNQAINSLIVSNQEGMNASHDAELTVGGGVEFLVNGTIVVRSANELAGGDDVGFILKDDNTLIECVGFLWLRENSRAGTDMLFRMYNDSRMNVYGDFYLFNYDNTSSENSVDFLMGNNTEGPDDEAPYLFIAGDFLVKMEKTDFPSYLSMLIRERSTIEVMLDMRMTMIDAPEDSDLYLYFADLPSRSAPGTNNLDITYTTLIVHGQLILEIPFIANYPWSPDIRCDFRGNSYVEVGGFQMMYLNGNGIVGGNGAQDIDFYVLDKSQFIVKGDVKMISELQTPTTPTLSNVLLLLQDDSYTRVEGDITMRAEVDQIEGRILMDGSASLELWGSMDRNDGSIESNYTTEGRLQLTGNSTVILGGDVPQVLPWAYLGHYQNLTINNSSGEVIQLEGDVRINKHLQMETGILKSEFSSTSANTDDLYVIDFLTTATANLGNPSSFITGIVRVTDRNASGVALHLPLGYSEGSVSEWGPMTVNNFDVTTNGSFYTQYVPHTPSNNTALGLPLEVLSSYEHWEIGRSSLGTYATGELFTVADFTLYWRNACSYGITEASSMFGAWLDNNNTLANLGDDKWWAGTTTTIAGEDCSEHSPDADGSVRFTFANVGTFRTRALTLASSNIGANPLPVELVSFKAGPYEMGKVLLTWTTASELNSDCFILERSSNGKDFVQLAKVPGAGTTNAMSRYRFIDPSPSVGINYYRLTQLDTDGATEVFPVVVCRPNGISSPHLEMFPNPVGRRNPQLNVQVPAVEGCFNKQGFTILNAYGADVPGRVSVDGFGFVVDTSALPTGLYVLRYEDLCGQILWSKLIKE
jgi:hypothetical protein